MQLRAPGISRSSFLLLLSLCATCVLSVRRISSAEQQLDNHSHHSLQAQENFLARRAIYVIWGSRSCPLSSKLLYHGFMANSHYTHTGSGYNYLCMHPEPQFPRGHDFHDDKGASLYGVEYRDTGVLGLDKDMFKDAACAVCQYQNGGATYVEWGHGEPQHNPSTPTKCSKEGHETIYTGLVMGTHYMQKKSEHICVDLKRAAHPRSEDKDDSGCLLYTTEMEAGSSDEEVYSPWRKHREVGCTVCGIPARTRTSIRTFQLDPNAETSVYTRWGHTSCGNKGRLIYTGFIAGSSYNHSGGGANSICMTISGAAAPSGYSDLKQGGNLLYGTEYGNDKDAACAVCEHTEKHTDTYIQWGRQACSNQHTSVYRGLVMGSKYNHYKSMHLCVDTERMPYARYDPTNHDGNLLYTTLVYPPLSEGPLGPHNSVAACTECAASGAGRTIFTRWGSESCPAGSSLLYSGWMASSVYNQSGGGANTLCMHIEGQSFPVDESNSGNHLMGMKYQDTGTIDKNHNKDAACAVCELHRWEAVYTQWGRSESCSNGHQTLYSGFVMSTQDHLIGQVEGKGEWVCVDEQRQVTTMDYTGLHYRGGQLYTTEMNQGSSDEDQYPNSVEVGCSVCAAISEKDEKPFAAQQGNALHGEWVRLRSLHTGQEVTVSYGFEKSQGTASTEEETNESAWERSRDMSLCFSATFKAGVVLASAETGAEACAGYGITNSESVVHTTAMETSWDVSVTETTENTFSVPDAPPAGTPQSATIQSYGVYLWQWQWTIVEGSKESILGKERRYTAKANSHYLFSPNDPEEGDPRRPCCFPGQEFGLWYPFNCKSEAGMLKGADTARHCRVGPATDSADHIASMTTQEVAAWLGSLGLSGNYDSTVRSRGMDGKALAVMVKIVDKAAVNHGDSDSTRALELVEKTFAVGEQMGDAYKILDALIALLASRE